MFIKSVILDGFKSYAKRTEITDFDPFFNAITGLNGTGKSNILDGICFLLGISNLSQVRANNLLELIYKGGQGGVSKASVTVTFDNTDKKHSPVGYEDFDEITLTRIVSAGGRTKYLINGCNTTNTRISDLFCSVNMNVNNPHFLIMQGRITKVLNMKPAEILSMIEEATGTKMYETKRQIALNTINKKDLKLAEINRLLNDEITPTITKLKDERSSYLDFQKMNRELEHFTRVCLANEYLKLKQKKVKMVTSQETTINEKQQLGDSNTELNLKLEEVLELIKKLQLEFDKESGNELQTNLARLKDATNDEVRASSNFQYSQDHLKELKHNREIYEEKLKKTSLDIQEKGEMLETCKLKLTEQKEEKERLQCLLDACVKQGQSTTIGISDSGTDFKSITEEIISTRNMILDYEAEIEKLSLMIKNLENECSLKQKEIVEDDSQFNLNQKTLENQKKEHEKLTEKIKTLNYDSELFEEKSKTKNSLEINVKKVQNSINQFETKNPHLIFSYNDPQPDFDRRRVDGFVGSLFQVVDERFTLAIEACAGAKLFNVVVDSDETVKLLIKLGKLKRRTTFIAKNRVQVNSIGESIVERARQLTGSNVWTASSLVKCSAHVQVAIDFVLGNTLIVEDSECAKKLAYDKSISRRCVTLDGDIFESSGTLTGGSRSHSSLTINKFKELIRLRDEVYSSQEELKKVEDFMQSYGSKTLDFNKLIKEVETISHSIHVIQSKLKSSRQYRLNEEISGITQQIQKSKEEKSGLSKKLSEQKNRLGELEEKSKNEDAFRQEMKEKLEKNIKETRSKLSKVEECAASLEQTVENLQYDIDDLKREFASLSNENSKILNEIEKQDKAIAKNSLHLNEIKNTIEKLESRIRELRAKMSECDNRMRKLDQQKAQLTTSIFDAELKIKELSQNINQNKQIIQNLSLKIQEMAEKNEWLVKEEKNFNTPGSAFDFTKFNMTEIKEKLDWLKSSVEKMSRTINTRAMNMLSQAEEKYNDLMRKKKIVENDRKKIQLIIKDLDDKKNDSLKSSWKKVNKDFGSIFSSLLPGASAKLCPIEVKNVLEGLEIRVGFGNTWKEGLNELSGGQRSLVALSLILSLLLFKPAPIYILDEVDAALDISHTQNIGVMLRSHFRHSQFIIVSLKDGMFSNANVLFKTKFVNGVSNISRLQHSSTFLKHQPASVN